MDFQELARSGTAPEPSKAKNGQVSSSTFGARPKTRSVESDVQDFNIDLRTNKPNFQKFSYDEDDEYYDSDRGHSEDLLQQAIESFQADLEDWSGRKDYDSSAPNTNHRQQAISSGRRSSRDGRKSAHPSAVSAYTQNVPQIVLQTSRKGAKIQASSPRPKEAKADLRADIRAVYGADILEKGSPTIRPKSQKPHIQSTSGNNNKSSNEAMVMQHSARQSDDRSYDDPVESEAYRQPIKSTSGTGRSASANRVRGHINASNSATTGSSNTAIMKPTSAVRKVTAPGTSTSTSTSSSGPRLATVPRPFSHSEVRSSSSAGSGGRVAAGSTRQATIETPTSSSNSKRVVKQKSPGSAASPLLKSSLAQSRSRASDSPSNFSADEGGDGDSDEHTNDSLPIPSNYVSKESGRPADYPVKRSSNESSRTAQPSAMEVFLKERASTAHGRMSSTRKSSTEGDTGSTRPARSSASPPPASSSSIPSSSSNNYSFSKSAGTAGNGIGNMTKPRSSSGTTRAPYSPASLQQTSNSSNNNNNTLYTGKSHSSSHRDRDSLPPSGRVPSKSPTQQPELSLLRPESDAALIDFIQQDLDIMEESFDESPILAAYMQRRANTAVNTPQKKESEEHHKDKDSAGRPQSRKLYLGAEKDPSSNTSTSGGSGPGSAGSRTYKTAPRSAGPRYSMAENSTSPLPGSSSPAVLRKMSSFNELMPQSRKWNEPSVLPDNRPPSRQSSAFPVNLNLAESPASSADSAFRHADADADGAGGSTVKVTSAKNKVVPSPQKQVSSMRWNRSEMNDDMEEPLEEDLAVPTEEAYIECEVESNPNSEVESPRLGRVGGMKSSSALAAALGSGENSVHTSLSGTSGTSAAATASTKQQQLASTTVTTSAGPITAAIVPVREHIGVGRAVSHEDQDDMLSDTSTTHQLQRPPSRQKFAAPQHLFEGMPPPTRVGTESESTRGIKSSSGNPSQEIYNADAVGSSRSGTSRVALLKYNPRDDGFEDIEVGAEPFVIKFNTDDAMDKTACASVSCSNRAHRRSHGSLVASGNPGPSHSRSSSSNSNQWDYHPEHDGILSPHTTHRPQTVAAGVSKPPRLLQLHQTTGNMGYVSLGSPTSAASSSASARGKTADGVLKSLSSGSGTGGNLSSRREANTLLYINPPQSQSPIPTMNSGRAGLTPSKPGEFTAVPPPARAQNNGWTNSNSEPLRNPRAQGVKIVESTHIYDNYGMTPVASSHSLARRRSLSADISNEFLSDDDMTIMTEDSGEHNMEGGMSMHSLALDSSLGEDFLSLFAPAGP